MAGRDLPARRTDAVTLVVRLSEDELERSLLELPGVKRRQMPSNWGVGDQITALEDVGYVHRADGHLVLWQTPEPSLLGRLMSGTVEVHAEPAAEGTRVSLVPAVTEAARHEPRNLALAAAACGVMLFIAPSVWMTLLVTTVLAAQLYRLLKSRHNRELLALAHRALAPHVIPKETGPYRSGGK